MVQPLFWFFTAKVQSMESLAFVYAAMLMKMACWFGKEAYWDAFG